MMSRAEVPAQLVDLTFAKQRAEQDTPGQKGGGAPSKFTKTLKVPVLFTGNVAVVSVDK